MKWLGLVLILLLSPVIAAQENLVNPAAILNECTKSRVVCEDASKSCASMGDTVNSIFSWTGLKILVGVVLAVLACFFLFNCIAAVVRFFNDLRLRRERNRYIDQLEASNKTLLALDKTVLDLSEHLVARVALLERENVLLAEFRATHVVDGIKKSEPKKSLWFSGATILLILLIIVLIITFWWRFLNHPGVVL